MTQTAPTRRSRHGSDGSLASEKPSRRHLPRIIVPVAVVLLIASAVTYRASSAAFTASTSTGTSTFTSGTVNLSNSQSASALFAATGLAPGATSAKCVVVTYSGNLAAEIRLYAATTGNGLADYLTVKVEYGTGANANCSDFVATATLTGGSDPTLTTLATTYTNYASGFGAWVVTGASTVTRTYRVTYTLPGGTGNAAQNKTADMTLSWEAQNT